MYVLEFTLKGLPKTTNTLSRANWKGRMTNARTWKRKVWACSWAYRPESPLPKAKLTLTRKSSVEPDFDGLVSSFKCVIDGLRDAGILVDDKMSVVGRPEYLWEKVGRGDGSIKVRVEEVQASGI